MPGKQSLSQAPKIGQIFGRGPLGRGLEGGRVMRPQQVPAGVSRRQSHDDP